jgi:hypothetical protein
MFRLVIVSCLKVPNALGRSYSPPFHVVLFTNTNVLSILLLGPPLRAIHRGFWGRGEHQRELVNVKEPNAFVFAEVVIDLR